MTWLRWTLFRSMSITVASSIVPRLRISPEATPAANPAFDVTPARLVTGLITERGIAPASAEGLAALFPEHAPKRELR